MRARVLCLLALSLTGLSACANPPRWVRRTPPFSYLYRPWGLPYMENPKFSFEMKRNWMGPEPSEGGVRFRSPSGSARITVNYFIEGAPGWRPKKSWNQWMRQQGSTEDSHIVDTIAISSRAAAHVVFTEHEYDPEYLLGAKSAVRLTEMAAINDEQGVFVIRYDALRRDFERFRPVFLRVLDSLTLAFVDPPPPE